jgi:hypothetical protein
VLAALAVLRSDLGAREARRLHKQFPRLPPGIQEARLLAYVRNGAADDAAELEALSVSPHESQRTSLAQAFANAARVSKLPDRTHPILARLRVDPSPRVRTEAALAAAEEKLPGAAHDVILALDGGILDQRRQGPSVQATALARDGETLEDALEHAFDRLVQRSGAKLHLPRTAGEGRRREAFRLARAAVRAR